MTDTNPTAQELRQELVRLFLELDDIDVLLKEASKAGYKPPRQLRNKYRDTLYAWRYKRQQLERLTNEQTI